MNIRLLVIGLLATAMFLAAPDVSTAQLSANEYRQLSDYNRAFYVTGLLEGWQDMLGSMRDLNLDDRVMQATYGSIVRCVGKMTREQVRAIVDKHVQANPESWHGKVSSYIFVGLMKACS